MTEPAPTMESAVDAATDRGVPAGGGDDPAPGSVGAGRAGPDPVGPQRFGAEMSAARAALVALVAGGALAVAAARAVELLVVIAVVQAAFVVSWALGAAVAVVPGESFDGPEGEVELGPTPALLGAPEPAPAPDARSEAWSEARSDAEPGGGSEFATSAEAQTATGARPAAGALAAGPALPADVALPAGPVLPADVALPRAGAMPGRIGALVIGGGTAAATDYAVMHWPHSALSPMLGILGLAVPVMFAHQLIRGVVRARVVESLSGIALIIAAVVALPALVQLRHEAGGGHLVAATTLVGGVAVALGLLVDLIWSRPRFDPAVPRGLTGVVVGTVAGAAIGSYLLRHQPQFTTAQALVYCGGIAAVSALVGVATSLVGYSSPATGFVPRGARLLRPVALALLPLMLVTPAAYVLLVSA